MSIADPKYVEERDKERERLAQQRHADIVTVMQSVAGRRLFWWLLGAGDSLAHVYQPGMSLDEVAYWSGRQFFARELMASVNASEKGRSLYQQTQREAHDNGW